MTVLLKSIQLFIEMLERSIHIMRVADEFRKINIETDNLRADRQKGKALIFFQHVFETDSKLIVNNHKIMWALF